jgi:hypothetical protein
MRRKQNCSTRSQSRTLVVLRRGFGPNSWNSSDIRNAPYATKRTPKEWAKVQVELEQLRKATSPIATGDAGDPYSTQ